MLEKQLSKASLDLEIYFSKILFKKKQYCKNELHNKRIICLSTEHKNF